MFNSLLSLAERSYELIQDILEFLAYYAWSPVSICLLLGTGIFLTYKLRFIQLKTIKRALLLLIYGNEKESSNQEPGRIKHPADESLPHAISEDIKSVAKPETQKLSGFQALSTVLSGTIGTGNIAGVATAIVMGGPGALFWMWVTGFFGMATKFASCTLAHHYRQKDEHNNFLGGPMITLAHALNYHGLAKVFAAFMILGCLSTGSMVQANSIADSATYLIPSLVNSRVYIGLFVAVTTGIVIIGGVQRIANVATIIVPFMAIAYVATACFILAIHYADIPKTFYLIFQYAFSFKAVAGASFWLVIRSGVARGLFASEAGLGTAPIALANLDTKNSVEAGLIGMLGPMFDTLIICTMTGLIIIASGVYDPSSTSMISGAPLSQKAFATGFNCIGDRSSLVAAWIVGLGLTLFAYTTILTWAYYGDRCVSYLFGSKYIIHYRLLFLLILVLGAVLKLEIVWNIADIANIGMTLPNLIAIIMLRNKIVELMRGNSLLAKNKASKYN